MLFSFWLPLVFIFITIFGVSLGRLPVLRMNRATIALVGAVILISCRAITTEQAYQAIDINTIVLLFSIMIINANFRLCGFFNLISQNILKLAKTPRRLLALLIFFSGLLSALFLNDTIVLVFTPLVVQITTSLKRNPIPYLMALATSANVGSIATIIGNPQNIIIGTFSGISFAQFSLYLIPVAASGLVVIFILITLIYKREFCQIQFDTISLPKFRIYRPLLKKASFAAVFMLGALMIGIPTHLAAMCSASLLLITRRLKSERVFAEIDWSLLVFFCGLFIVTKTIETIDFSRQLLGAFQLKSSNEMLDLTIVSTLSSNLISNVPAVLLLKNMIVSFSNLKIAWLTLAMATTLAGNLTLLGSVANLIVAETAKKGGITLSFVEYLRAGVLITGATIGIGFCWLSLFY